MTKKSTKPPWTVAQLAAEAKRLRDNSAKLAKGVYILAMEIERAKDNADYLNNHRRRD
jgi:hypothetical protein